MMMLSYILVLAILLCGSVFADEVAQSPKPSPWDREGWNTSPVIREACSGIHEWYLCAAAAESAFIAMNPTVTHASGILRISLSNGKELTFNDNVDTGGYMYLGMVSPLPFHLVLFSYEDNYYMLINADTGWRTSIDAFPVVSPNKEQVATAVPDFRGDRPNAVQIWSVESDTLRLDYSLNGYEDSHPNISVLAWGPKHPLWLGSDTLRCDVICQTRDGGRLDQVMTVWRSGNGWTYAFSDVPGK